MSFTAIRDFLLVALGLTTSDKLDRTYLPSSGAQLPTRNPEVIQSPLELSYPVAKENLKGPQEFEYSVPTTITPIITTSYAFTQTTTFPSTESYEKTTVVPINFLSDLLVQSLQPTGFQQYTQNLPTVTQNQDKTTTAFNTNVQPEFSTESSDGRIIIIGTPDFSKTENKHQYLGQNGSAPVNITEFSSSMSIPKDPIRPQGDFGQEIYSVLPINDENVELTQFHHENQNKNGILSHQPFIGNQDIVNPFLPTPQSITLGQKYNDISSSASVFEPSSSTSAYSFTDDPITRPESSQEATNRNAVIENYENTRSPNGYSYVYDTSNRIHAEETGTVGDGTRVQGSYSYTGDDGKVYKVDYIADENGFQPSGDHIPTAPPTPDAIQKVIELAARDKAAGIFDDGSYDEKKYGNQKYQISKKYPIQTPNPIKIYDDLRKEQVIPIVEMIDTEYNVNLPPAEYSNFDDNNKIHFDQKRSQKLTNRQKDTPTQQHGFPKVQNIIDNFDDVEGSIVSEQQLAYLSEQCKKYKVNDEYILPATKSLPSMDNKNYKQIQANDGDPSLYEFYDQPKVILETAGPKRVPNFDPQLGYYYK